MITDGLTAAPRVAAPRRAPHARRTPFALLVLGLIVGGMCTLLALNTAAAANEVGRHDVADRDEGVAAQLVELQNDARASAAPANLAAAAAALGMVPAGDPAFLMIGPDGKVTVRGVPVAAQAVAVAAPEPAKKATKKATKSSKKNAAKAKAAKAAKDKAANAAKEKAAKEKAAKSKKATKNKTNNKKTTQKKTKKKKPPKPAPTATSTLPGGNR